MSNRIERETFDLDSNPVTSIFCRYLTHETGASLGHCLLERLGGRHGADFRHPFGDVRVVALLLSFPHEQRVLGRLAKPVLRRAMVDTLPRAVRSRPDKAEFSSYARRCFIGPYQKDISQLLRGGALMQHGLIDGTDVNRRLETNPSSLHLLIGLLSLELWLREAVR